MSQPFTVDPQTMHPDHALHLVRESIGDVIDLGGVEEDPERPGYSMDLLKKTACAGGLLGKIVVSQDEGEIEAEAAG